MLLSISLLRDMKWHDAVHVWVLFLVLILNIHLQMSACITIYLTVDCNPLNNAGNDCVLAGKCMRAYNRRRVHSDFCQHLQVVKFSLSNTWTTKDEAEDEGTEEL